jgi:hypothetical protein
MEKWIDMYSINEWVCPTRQLETAAFEVEHCVNKRLNIIMSMRTTAC